MKPKGFSLVCPTRVDPANAKTPGMAMTYIYEPNGDGVVETGQMPTKAPSHRLTTSLDSRYAS